MNFITEDKKGRNKLSEEEICKIKNTYEKEKNIRVTAKLTNHSVCTVNKYVRYISSKKQNSRYNARVVVKMIPETLEIVRRYKTATIASKVEHIEISNLYKALAGKQKTAGGFVWSYEDELDNKEPCTKYFVSTTRQMDVLLGLK